jgi:hypothetical protein
MHKIGLASTKRARDLVHLHHVDRYRKLVRHFDLTDIYVNCPVSRWRTTLLSVAA